MSRPKPGSFSSLDLGHRPLRARTHQGAHEPEAGERGQHLAHRVPVDAEGKRLADADVVEWLRRVVDRRLPHWPVIAVSWTATLSPSCFLDRLRLRVRQVTELDVGAPGADRGRPHGGLGADEELVAVEVRAVLDEVVGVPLALERRAPRVVLELEGPRAHRVRLEVVRVLVQVLLREDDVPRRGQVGQERGRRELELEHHRVGVGSLHLLDRRVGVLPDAADALAAGR